MSTEARRVTLQDVHARLGAIEAALGSAWTVRETPAPEEDRPILEAPGAVARYLFATRGPADGRERFELLLLNARHRLIRRVCVSIGCLTASLVHAREVFRVAIQDGAGAIVLTHNHPSGDPEPSGEDLALTRRLAAGGSLLGIEVLDHIVTGDGCERWVSLKERGSM